jgi:hypothetical protein
MLRIKARTRPARLLCFDVENRPLSYWWGDKTTAEITAIGWKWRHQPDVQTLLLSPGGGFRTDDGRSISAPHAYHLFRDELARADCVFGHNVRRHDLPLFQSGLLRLHLGTLPELRTTDTLRDYPRKKDMSASLESFAYMYGLELEKPNMPPSKWEVANRLTRDGIGETRNRVVADVLLQEALRDKLADLGLLGPQRIWKP